MIRLFAIITLLWAAAAAAQTSEDDRDWITGLIEDSISNDDLVVRLTGFEGVLSSEATAEAITLADADGVWLRLEDISLIWDRSALLSGAVEIENMSAERIELFRLPNAPEEAVDLPSAEATPLTLPDLPVSVEITSISASEIVLTDALLGEAITARFAGALSLEDGVAATDFILERTDAKEGRFDVTAGFEDATRQLTLSLLAQEGDNGIAARMLSIPGSPSVRLSIDGDAPLDDFLADISLATGGVDRITGTALISRPSGTIDQAFALDLSGDLRPLLIEDYHPFFGADTRLQVEGTQFGLGGLRLSTLTIEADQINLDGSARLDAEGWPVFVDLRGQLAALDGTRVVLPVAGPKIEMASVSLSVSLDAEAGDQWSGSFDITQFSRDDVLIDALALSGGGTIKPGEGDALGGFSADMSYAARGLDLGDSDLNQAVGADIEGTVVLSRTEDGPLRISDLSLDGAGLTARAFAVIAGPDNRFETTFDLGLTADDFGRFAPLAGLDLAGTGELETTGTLYPFDGIFNVDLTANTLDLAVGIAQLDPLMTGQTDLIIAADRDTTGTRLHNIRLRGDALNLDGSAELTSGTASADLSGTLANLGLIAPGLDGPASFIAEVDTDPQGKVSGEVTMDAPDARAAAIFNASPQGDGYLVQGDSTVTASDLRSYRALIGQPVGGAITIDATGQFDTISGVASADVEARTTDISIGNSAVDTLLRGLGRISVDLSLSETARLRLDALDVAFPNLSATGEVATSGTDTTANLAVRLRDIALLVSDFSGPLTADISARQDAAGWQVTGAANGPAGTNAQTSGRVGNDGTLSLTLNGSAPLALANIYIDPRQVSGLATFNLAIDGPPELASVRGPITISNARLSAPTLQQSFENLAGRITLAAGSARVELAANSTAGGDLTIVGPVSLTPPFRADITATLQDIVLRDPTLYRTTIRGAVNVAGPLTGGAAITGTLDLGDADIQVPSTGVSALGTLPEITHLGPRLEVRQTLNRAGIGLTPEATATATGPAYPLDVTVRAPSRIFVRGRGLDAELGGQLRLTGTTNGIIPIGRFDLVRGRLDILGQRFELDEGFAQLQGDFIPFLRLVATTQTRTGTTVSIIVEGPADAIEVRFESAPELPQDEVIAQLLFGRDLSSISPLQAVQLASAVATLAGTGGGGVLDNIREGLNLDDFDLTTDEDGNAAVRAGKYVSENVYTDVTIGTNGNSEINLNLEIDENFTARGTVASDGETSVGVFFERDY